MFLIHSTDDGRAANFEYMPAGTITPKLGTALKVTEGKLALCGATEKPAYISAVNKTAACTDGEEIPVIRVNTDMIFETTFAASAASVKVGDKLTIHSDAEQVTATTESGVAEVISMDGTAIGDKVRIRF